MTRDKKILYIISISLFGVLPLALLLPLGNSRIVAAVLLVPAAVAVYFLVQKRAVHSVYKRQVSLLMGAVAVAWLILLYALGLFVFGLYQNGNPNGEQLLSVLLPTVLGIIAIEIIRSVLLAQEDRLISILSWAFCFLAEIVLFADLGAITSFNRFMDVVGMVAFPAVTGNLLYHYLAKRYGFLPNTVYRVVLASYAFLLSYEPRIPDAIMAFGILILPLLAFLFMRALYEKKRVTHRKTRPLTYVVLGFLIFVMISVVMIVSCQFRFGMLVTATGSMTGEINKGDAVIYERYDGELVEEGQVIVFKRDKSNIIHRVVKIEKIDGETRYFTKGDANEEWDSGYITTADFVGTVKFKLAYVGYPTLWLRELFAGK